MLSLARASVSAAARHGRSVGPRSIVGPVVVAASPRHPPVSNVTATSSAYHSSIDQCVSVLSLCRITLPATATHVRRAPSGAENSGARFASTLVPPKQQQQQDEEGEIVTFLTLNNIRDNPGAVKKGRRVGRGIGCSKGKTCGRGHKGQKARAGRGISIFFEGGQTPLHKRIPKRGFRNSGAEPMVPINVEKLQNYVDMGRLVPPGPSDPPLTIPDLIDAGIVKKSSVKFGVKLLAKGKERLRTPLRIEVSRASKAAIDAIERVGGEVVTVHYNKLALKALIKPHRFDIIPRRAFPPPKLMPYYTSYEHRGYLSPEVQLRKVRSRLDSTPDESRKSDE